MAHPRGRACLCRDGEGLDLARQILGARLRTAELARAGARQGARRDQLDEAVHAGDRADAVADRLAQRGALGVVAGAALDEHSRRFLAARSEEHTSELQSLMRISYAGF